MSTAPTQEKYQELINEWGVMPASIPLFAYVEYLGTTHGPIHHSFFAYHPKAPDITPDGKHMAMSMAFVYDKMRDSGVIDLGEPPDQAPSSPAS